MNVKFIAAGAGLVAVGAVYAWAYTADRADQKRVSLEKMFDMAMEELGIKGRTIIDLRYELNDKIEELEQIHSMIDEEAGFTDEKNPEGEVSEISSEGEIEWTSEEPEVENNDEVVDEAAIEESRSHLQALISQYVPSKEDEEVFVEKTSPATKTKYTPPFVITQEEYAWSEDVDDYAKITITYYPKYQVLLDEDEELIEDVDGCVGWRSLNRFGEDSGDADIVYVRNHRLEVDFEVVRETEEEIPLHVKYAMPKVEFISKRAAGKLRLAEEDM